MPTPTLSTSAKRRALSGGERAADPRPRLQVLMLGDSNVGKTSLMERFYHSQGEPNSSFQPSSIATAGIDTKTVSLTVNGVQCLLTITDSAGQERFRSIAFSFYKKAHAIMLCYDVTSLSSFLQLHRWLASISQMASSIVVTIIVANKIDLEQERVVSVEAGQELASRYRSMFFEASAKTNENVAECFMHAAQLILPRLSALQAADDAYRSERLRLVQLATERRVAQEEKNTICGFRCSR